MFGRNRKPMIVLGLMAMLLLVAATACYPDVLGFYVSMVKAGTTDDGLDYDTNDILFVDPYDSTPQWYKIFDGDATGLTPKHNIQAFSFNELIFHGTFTSGVTADVTGPLQLYLTFSQNQIKVPGISGNVFGQDIVQFDGEYDGGDWLSYDYSLLFDGSDVGLTTRGEKLDGISVWPPEYYDLLPLEDIELPYDCNAGVLFLTTQGAYRVPDNQGGFLTGDGSDVLLFCAVNLGTDTAGFWFRAFDGSDAGITPRNAGFGVDVWALEFVPSVTEDAGDLDLNIVFFFTPKKAFSSNDVTGGQPSQLFVGGNIDGTDGTEGPFYDFNSGIDVPAVNGVVDTVGVFDWPFTTPP